MRFPLAIAVSTVLLSLHILSPADADSPRTDSAAANSKPVPLKILTWDETQKLVAAQKGKVVVLDLWSTYCAPCMREFPHLVELHTQHKDDVACLAMNLNYAGLNDEPPESFRDVVLQFLEKQGAEFPNIISKDPDLEVFETIDLASIPAVYVYDRRGKLVKRFDNDDIQGSEDEFTYERDVLPLVRKLIREK